MTSKRNRFFFTIVASVVGILVVSFAVSRVLDAYTQRSIRTAETDALIDLANARSSLGASSETDPLQRISSASAFVEHAINTLGRAGTSSSVIKRSVAAITSFLPFHNPDVRPSSKITVQARTMADALAWLTQTVPSLRRIAGYDADADVHSATNSHDLFVRMYVARVGLGKTLEGLRDPPPSIPNEDARLSIHSSRQAYELTAPLIRALDTGDATSTTELLRQYVSASATAAQHATDAVDMLTDENFLTALVSPQ